MHRFFVDKDRIPVITGSDVHHIRDVLRLKAGDELKMLDGTGTVYSAKISEIKKERVICDILSSRNEEKTPEVKVTLAQCLPKAKKMDLIVQKCTELGAQRIIPVLSERSIPRSGKLERWKKIAKEAAEQSGRSFIPEISPLTKFEDLLKMKNEFDLALIPWELEKRTTLKKVLTTHHPNHLTTILILIGPEGGFSRDEVERARSAGFIAVSLGPRILRTETAAMAMLSMIDYEYS